MICKNPKCAAELPDDAVYCLRCGRKQITAGRKPRQRGNGTGTVYQLPNKKWRAMKTTFYIGADNKKHCRTISKSSFTSKRDAVDYLPFLGREKEAKREKRIKEMTFKALYDAWLPTHDVKPSTLGCYTAAIKYFKPIWFNKMMDIDIEDLQGCVDDCPKGRRTKENMKALARLMYKYGIPRSVVRDNLNLAEYLKVSGETGHKDALTVEELKKIKKHIGKVPYADYVYCQCYLGFRPSEFLALDASAYNVKERAFVGGAKTEAGTDRTVTISPKIQRYVDALVNEKSSGAVFCDAEGAAMNIKTYRDAFYSVLQACGIDNPITKIDGRELHRLTPHSCRHTFATLMKRVDAPDKDKLELIGHTSEEMLRHYQDVSFEDLRKITDQI